MIPIAHASFPSPTTSISRSSWHHSSCLSNSDYDPLFRRCGWRTQISISTSGDPPGLPIEDKLASTVACSPWIAAQHRPGPLSTCLEALVDRGAARTGVAAEGSDFGGFKLKTDFDYLCSASFGTAGVISGFGCLLKVEESCCFGRRHRGEMAFQLGF